ncbi:MAG: class I SAM-dependent methyltransferase [Dysgonamonadaceae bacterium]|nr:class I SAM-dependent methyltransferase [Dysgonamonadaceae bacterium]MDD4728051.1 class I SAM-dependent methyltransferase [Dysgonamonadaceae bacterium]
MDNNITDKNYWDNYWSNYKFEQVPEKVVFKKYMPSLSKGNSFIEIGGFPGVFASYFYKHGVKDVTLLDFYINKDIVHNFEKANGIPPDTIQCIKSDFFTFNSERKYDIVFSAGFVEHFLDTKNVIKRHVDLLSDNGQLLILLPNFLGLNGYVQKIFDKENLESHNLDSMKIKKLREIVKGFDLNNAEVDYIGKPMLWLEPKPQNMNKRKYIKMLSYLSKLLPVKSRLMSPYIVIYGSK